jgi:hypothetical protein
MRQKRRERFWTANGGSRRDEPQDGVSNVVHRHADKTARCRLTARNTIVHRPRIYTKSAFKLTNFHLKKMVISAYSHAPKSVNRTKIIHQNAPA